MPKALKKGAARLRKERFSEEELSMLADTLAENRDVVFSNDMRRPAMMRKKEVWAWVARKVSAVGTTPRTVKDVQKCWDDLRLRVHNIISANRSQGMATCGGAASPIKMTRWEETCSSTIGMEAIEGVGDMERGALSSADAGTQSESEDQDPREEAATPAKKSRGMEGANRPSTSRGRGQPGLLRMPNTTQEPTAQMCIRDTTTAPTPATSTQEPVAEGTVSTASSTVRETAATAALSDDEQHTPTPETPTATGPQQSPQLSPPSNQYASSHELSAVKSWPGSFTPTGACMRPPTILHAPSTSASVRDRQEGIRVIQQCQEELKGLVTQHIHESGQAWEDFRDCAASLKAAIESTSANICNGLAAVRHVLTCMVEAFEDLRPT
ncbi:myb-related transcription factor, partner of profilin-like [Ambystoma mexicanum]|uniref:myb-related transcription factor, partner of profilin-like n=1 Tax=Ambystoma mexicanum TaxID=8296 RepID=UPI0037E96F9B